MMQHLTKYPIPYMYVNELPITA